MESVVTYPHSLSGLHPISAFSKSSLGRLSFSLREIEDGNRRARFSRRNSEGEKSINGDDKSSENKTYNKEEILALFRRIQSSISNGESKGRNSNSSTESVLQVLHQSRKQVKGKTSNKEGNTERKKEERVDFASTEVKISRPPSNFVKRSPIPYAYAERIENDAKNGTDGEELENMKLVALKEVAKSRGIKGYSKLKKSVLIELLKKS